MKRIKNIFKGLILTSALLTLESCTKLDENIYNAYVAENYYNNKNEVLSAVLRPYTHASGWATPGQNNYWRISELTADQLAWPQKGKDGLDGGRWMRDHWHTWTNDDESVWNPWLLMWTGVGYCNQPIENMEKLSIAEMKITQAEKDAYIADLKLLRAYTYLKLMDLFGNIPIVTKVGESNPPTKSRKEVFNFVEQEIKENIEKIPVLSSALVGRMSRAAAYAMLAELYLNAEEWTGTPRWDDCIAACNMLINKQVGAQTAAGMQLDADISIGYNPSNSVNSKENIFVIKYDPPKGGAVPQWKADFYHFKILDINGGNERGNNGVVLIPGVWTGYKTNDLRKTSWFMHGQQYKFGLPQTSANVVTGDPLREYVGKPLIFVDNIRKNITAAPFVAGGVDPNTLPSDMTTGEENSGIRFDKYKIGVKTAANYAATDYALYRLTWIYFAKAEAIMRKNGGLANLEAVTLINDCKKRAFSPTDWVTEQYTVATLTMDELLKERGREFIFEGWRRQDLIRFDKFVNTAWWDHVPTNNKNLELFPIPNRQITLNPNLKQNPGY